ncbi:DUF4862 family protein [Actinotalea sp. K2]|uniref:DUF4862 family protein n=1 Tax=Actinotalea sp. K2 TaxID=2939438 RepID=UPI002016BD57|nr:DUF4862 family protein [Actinotalea sp. K2]MCL3859505.1 DUF4862 family protein [Actinotalea sp. K2]
MTIPAPDQPGARLLGAYSMAPADPVAETELYDGVARLGVAGLEMPLPPEGAPSLEPGWLARNLRPEWDLLLTCIPTVMSRLGTDPAHGLASADDASRRRAVADVARARDLALHLADTHGRRQVTAIQVHSAPGPDLGTRDAFARSLEEILGWDTAGAEFLVEHCDALVDGQSAAKGFWTLEDEIATIRRVAGDAPAGTALGVSINWGRSAIEGRSAQTALAHLETAVEAGLLRALVLSGASDVETPWGPAWGDAHIPPRGQDPALAASSASLLGPDEVAAALDVATRGGTDPLIAVKVSVRPRDVDVATRLAVARAALDLTR